MDTEKSAGQSGTPPAHEGMFVRKASGLVREFRLRDALGVNFAILGPAGIGFFFFAVLIAYPGSDLTLPLLVTFVGAVGLSLCYSQLLAAIPRTGADFIYISRIFHPALGALAGVAFLISLINAGGPSIALMGNTYLPAFFQSLGAALHWDALTTFATTLSGHTGTLIVAIVEIALVAVCMVGRVTVATKVAFWAILLSLVGMFLLVIVFLVSSQHEFVTKFGELNSNPHAYSQMISAAKEAGVTTQTVPSATWSSIGLVALLWSGAAYSNYMGGELRRPSTTFRNATFICLGVSLVLCLGVWLTFKHAVGLEFLHAAAGLSEANPERYAEIAGPVSNFVPSYGGVLGGEWIPVVINLGFVLGLFALLLAITAVISRLVFALGFDRVIPSAMADVTEKHHSPRNAILFACVGMFGFTILAIYSTGVLPLFRNFALVQFTVYALSAFAAAALPWLRADLYQSAPKVVGKRILGLPAITVYGVLTGLWLALVIFMGATKSQVSGGYSTSSILTLVVCGTAGLVAYYISRAFLKRRGVELDLANKELPPE